MEGAYLPKDVVFLLQHSDAVFHGAVFRLEGLNVFHTLPNQTNQYCTSTINGIQIIVLKLLYPIKIVYKIIGNKVSIFTNITVVYIILVQRHSAHWKPNFS